MEDDNFFVHKPLPPSVLKRLKEKRKRKKRKIEEEVGGGATTTSHEGSIDTKRATAASKSNASIPETRSAKTASRVSSSASTAIIDEEQPSIANIVISAPVDADAGSPQAPAPIIPSTQSNNEDTVEDMLPELALRARQRIMSKSQSTPSPAPPPSAQQRPPTSYSLTGRTPTPSGGGDDDDDDDIFDVFISVYSQVDGKLESEKPMSFKIRSTHPLSRVKQAWATHKGIANSSSILLQYVFMLQPATTKITTRRTTTTRSSGPISADSVLTQVFDSTTPVALNIKQTDEPYPRLVLVAMTRTELAHLKGVAEEKRRKFELQARGEKNDDDDDDEDDDDDFQIDEGNETDKDQDQSIRLKLLSEDGTVKVRVSRKAKVSDLINVVRSKAKAKGQAELNEIRLEFDAELMAPGSSIQDYDLEDEDTIDVHVDQQQGGAKLDESTIYGGIPDIVDLE